MTAIETPPPTASRRGDGWWGSAPGLLLSAAMLTSAAAWWLIAWPVATVANVPRHVDHFPPLYLHMLGGTIMLTCGAANLYIGATRRAFRWHRAIGLTYMLGGGLGALVALGLALGPAHPAKGMSAWTIGAVSNVGVSVGMLSIAWMLATAMAYRAIRNRRTVNHQMWMIRSYVLAWSFVFCRLASRVPSIGDLGNGEAFIWLSWVGPLVLCEVALQWKDGAPARRGARPDPITH